MILLPAVLCIIGPLPPNPPVVSYGNLKPAAIRTASSSQSIADALPIEGAANGAAAADTAPADNSPILKKSD